MQIALLDMEPGAAIGPACGICRRGPRALEQALWDTPGDYLPIYPYGVCPIRLHGLDYIVDACDGLGARRR